MKIVDWLFLPLNYEPVPKENFGSIWVDKDGIGYTTSKNVGYKCSVSMSDDLSSYAWDYLFNFTANNESFNKIHIEYNSNRKAYNMMYYRVSGDPVYAIHTESGYNTPYLTIQTNKLPDKLKSIFISETQIDKEYKCVVESGGKINNSTITQMSFSDTSSITFNKLDSIVLYKDLLLSGQKMLNTYGGFKVKSTDIYGNEKHLTINISGISSDNSPVISGFNINLWDFNTLNWGTISNTTISSVMYDGKNIVPNVDNNCTANTKYDLISDLEKWKMVFLYFQKGVSVWAPIVINVQNSINNMKFPCGDFTITLYYSDKTLSYATNVSGNYHIRRTIW